MIRVLEYLYVSLVMCRGVYTFQANATYGRSVLCGPKIKVSIQLDPMKPKKLQVKHSAMQQIAACDEMPGYIDLFTNNVSVLNMLFSHVYLSCVQ